MKEVFLPLHTHFYVHFRVCFCVEKPVVKDRFDAAKNCLVNEWCPVVHLIRLHFPDFTAASQIYHEIGDQSLSQFPKWWLICTVIVVLNDWEEFSDAMREELILFNSACAFDVYFHWVSQILKLYGFWFAVY